MIYLLALLLGAVAGLRSMTPPATIAWAAHLGWLDLAGTGLAFLGNIWSRIILTLGAIGELVADLHPAAPARTAPVGFGARLISGGFSGAALGLARDQFLLPAFLGVVGAIIGTLGGYKLRMKLAAAFGRDRPAALIEDAIAILAAVLIFLAMRSKLAL
jgi:uncharacterized membrane protein